MAVQGKHEEMDTLSANVNIDLLALVQAVEWLYRNGHLSEKEKKKILSRARELLDADIILPDETALFEDEYN